MKKLKTAAMLTLSVAALMGLAACDPGSLIPGGGGGSDDPCANAGPQTLCVPPVENPQTPPIAGG